jgi:hypothetical protein
MTHKFEVGDICITINDPTFTSKTDTYKYDGEECEVIAQLTNHVSKSEGWDIIPFCYKVRMLVDGAEFTALESELKLSDSGWAKKKVKALIDFPLPVELLSEELVCHSEA